MIEFYKILELNLDATEKELKDTFRRLSKIYHPDKNNGSDQFVEKFRLVRDAYERVLVFMKSPSFSTWKSKYSNTAKQSTTKSEKSTNDKHQDNQGNNFYDRTRSDSSFSPHFNFYEFVNKSGLFVENLFQINSKPIQKQYSLNETILTNSFEYKLLDFHFVQDLGKNFFKTRSEGFFLILELEIKNISKSMISLHNYMFRLFDYEGYFFEFSSNGLAALNFLQEPIIPFFGKQLNPKIKSTHKLIFEVPEKGDYFMQLCGGQYKWDNNNICICDEVSIVKLTNGC
jgi:curved DNA-binding protein CbpA